MTASFGRLEQETLTLEAGMNVICAPNEWGKSTWSAFLVAMFYGIDPSQRNKKGVLADKNKFQPWNGMPMSGTLECVVDGRTIVLERSGKRSGTPMSQFSAWYRDTGDPVPRLTGDNVGQTLLGVEREVFVRSAFIGETGLAIGQTPELERRIAALVSSGEDTSFSEAFAQLNSWKNRRKHNKTGLIPETSTQLNEIEKDLRLVEQSKERMLQYQASLESIVRSEKEVREKLDRWAAAEQQEKTAKQQAAQSAFKAAAQRFDAVDRIKQTLPRADQLRQGQELGAAIAAQTPMLDQQTEKIGRLQEEITQRNERAKEGIFEGKSPEDAWKQAQAAVEKCKELDRKAVFRPWLFALLCFVVFASIAAVVILSLQKAAFLTALGLVCAALVSAALPIILFIWYRKRTTVLGERASVCRIYHVKQPEEILEQAAAYREWQVKTEQLNLQLQEALAEQEERTGRLGQMEAQLFQLTLPFAPEAKTVAQAMEACSQGLSTLALWEREQLSMETLQKQWEAMEPVPEVGKTGVAVAPPQESKLQLQEEGKRLQREKTRCLEGVAMSKGEQAIGGDVEALQARHAALLSQRDALEEEYEALELAQTVLNDAHQELQSRFSPVLNEKASAWMARFSGGKYQDLRLDRTFSASVRTEEDPISRPDLMLSAGTMDQLYLAVRLAICELALKEDQQAPLILDDALIRFDDVRLQYTLDALYEAAQTRQILLFTCHGREAAYLSGKAQVHIMQANGSRETMTL